MKRLLKIITYTLIAEAIFALPYIIADARAQQFGLRTNSVVTVPAVVWRGSNAQVIASQLLALTNADGTMVIPPGMFTNHSSLISIRVDVGTNGCLRSIRATVR